MQDKNNASLCEKCLFSYEGVRCSDGTKQLICVELGKVRRVCKEARGA